MVHPETVRSCGRSVVEWLLSAVEGSPQAKMVRLYRAVAFLSTVDVAVLPVRVKVNARGSSSTTSEPLVKLVGVGTSGCNESGLRGSAPASATLSKPTTVLDSIVL